MCETPNLDCMTREELQAYANNESHHELLRLYATAQYCEGFCDGVFDCLATPLRW